MPDALDCQHACASQRHCPYSRPKRLDGEHRDSTVKSFNAYLEELRDRPAPRLAFTVITFDGVSTDIVHRWGPGFRREMFP